MSGAAKAVQFAYSRIGCKYTFGGTGPCSAGYDCSGLVQAAWLSAGVAIPRTTGSQWAALRHISRSSLQAGDLVFSNGFGHVMMYVGGGNVIESPHTGAFVKKTSLAGVGTVNGYARV
jgi:cell wall-associated NlpC family hydrolase